MNKNWLITSNNNKRYAIVGSHSCWKSTILNELKKSLQWYSFINELAREHILKSGKAPQHMTEWELEAFQFTLLSEQIKKESKLTYTLDDFISDRSVLDILAYSHKLDEEVYDILYNRVKEYFINLPYTKIFYVPIEFEIEADWIRYEWNQYREFIDDTIVRLLNEFKINYITLKGTTEERVSMLLKNI